MADDTMKVEQVTAEMDELSFDPSMKKKKSSARKKSVAFEDPSKAEVLPELSEAAAESGIHPRPMTKLTATGNQEEDMFAGKKKKAKKILVNAGDAEDWIETPAQEGDDLDFSNLKKKKKRRVIDDEVAALEAKLEEAGVVDDKEHEVEGEDPFTHKEDDEGRPEDHKDEEEAWLKSDRDYTYEELLHRVFRILRENNPSLGLGKKVTLPPPLVFREGSKRTIFANIHDMSVRLHRPLDHFKDYLFAELGTNGSVDGSNRLILKGRFQQKQLENVVRRYIHEYVTCKTCKSPDTLLSKENRVWFIVCENCGSKRSVSAIKTGFQAQTTKRRLLRNQAPG